VALVVLLRGVNVGGHRTFRPSSLADQLKHLDAVNIGAAGTFVIRRPITRTALRAELIRRLPFDAEIVICEGREIVRLLSLNHFADVPARSDLVRFVSVLSRRPRVVLRTPVSFPPGGKWLLKIVARDRQFVVVVYRRQAMAHAAHAEPARVQQRFLIRVVEQRFVDPLSTVGRQFRRGDRHLRGVVLDVQVFVFAAEVFDEAVVRAAQPTPHRP